MSIRSYVYIILSDPIEEVGDSHFVYTLNTGAHKATID